MIKCLEEIKRLKCGLDIASKERIYLCECIEKELKGKEELEKAFDTLSKEDEKAKKLLSKEIEKNRAFEIIKQKQVSVGVLLVLDNLQQYNDYCDMVGGCKKLTEEEYDLVKEALL